MVAAAQFDGDPPALLSVNNTAGPGSGAAGALGPKLRLLVSPVKPSATHLRGVLGLVHNSYSFPSLVPALRAKDFACCGVE
jgi:hypothetical protein